MKLKKTTIAAICFAVLVIAANIIIVYMAHCKAKQEVEQLSIQTDDNLDELLIKENDL